MGTVLRSKLSGKNPYHIERHRYLELKHFCLQYPIWEKAYDALCGLKSRPADLLIFKEQVSDPTAKCAEAMAQYSKWMNMVEESAMEVDSVIGPFVLEGVVTGKSYDILRAKSDVPCCKDKYYELYRKFFYILNKKRG